MSNFTIDNNFLSLESITKKGKNIKKIALNEPILNGFVTAVNNLIDSLVENNCDWKANDNLLLMSVIQNGLVFTKKLKKMNSDNKKKLILSLLLNVLDNQVKKNEDLLELKEKIVLGIETVVEPAIQLAMMTQNNELVVSQNCIGGLFKLCKPKKVSN